MIIDTSAVYAILHREPGFEQYLRAIESDTRRLMSAATLYETAVVLYKERRSYRMVEILREFVAEFGITIVAFDAESAWRALDAYTRYGKGIHPAKLNLMDCVAYQLAHEFSQPLLYKGADFAQTDVVKAV